MILTMYMATMRGKRLSIAQATILLMLKKSSLEPKKIVQNLGDLGIAPKSTTYTALKELERKGLVTMDRSGVYMLTESGNLVAERLSKKLDLEIERLLRYVSFLIDFVEGEETGEIEALLERFKRRKTWRKIPVE